VTASVAWPPSAAGELRRLIDVALAEDLDATGDLTTVATVPPDGLATAAVRTRVAGVAAGLDALGVTWAALDSRVAVRPRVADGATIAAGDVLAEVNGPARAVFTGERTALNLVGPLSGVATLTAAYVALAAGRCAIRDTRKTHAGMRALEKRAVVAGGGVNHRFGLSDGLLVKDNHVAAAGGIAAATRAALAAAGDRPVQIEVDDLDELEAVLGLGARSVLLDNFTLEELSAGVRRCRQVGETVFVEASGGVSLGTVDGIAGTGVDAIAVGALTHSAPVLDVGLDVLDVLDVPDVPDVEV
jgi:nicotinate-nucleotide pyrophosphorylase (carboxylating)